MVSENKNTYCPDYAVPPGATLLEVIQSKKMSQSELARRMGRPNKTINEIIRGKAEITSETAIQLEYVLNVPAKFWINLEKNYQLDLARIAEGEKLAAEREWLNLFPLSTMKKYGWIDNVKDSVSLIAKLLAFFGVASVEAWNQKWLCKNYDVLFRKSKSRDVDFHSLAVWLRKGEMDAEKIYSEKFDKRRFKDSLQDIRKLTTLAPRDFIGKMTNICASCGVTLVFVPELPKMLVHGVTRWLSADKVVIQLSLYKKNDDHFWFSFFHEAAHVILHGKRDFVYDEISKSWDNDADDFAQNTLLSKSAYDYFIKHNSGRFTSSLVKEFADSQNIAPGIVVGRLQHDGLIDFNQLNTLKRKFVWKKN